VARCSALLNDKPVQSLAALVTALGAAFGPKIYADFIQPKSPRRGTRQKKLEIVQLWRCAPCKRVFTEVTDQTAILVKLSPPDAAAAAAGAPASNRGRSGAPRGLSGPW
jgi:hypothetical protein